MSRRPAGRGLHSIWLLAQSSQARTGRTTPLVLLRVLDYLFRFCRLANFPVVRKRIRVPGDLAWMPQNNYNLFTAPVWLSVRLLDWKSHCLLLNCQLLLLRRGGESSKRTSSHHKLCAIVSWTRGHCIRKLNCDSALCFWLPSVSSVCARQNMQKWHASHANTGRKHIGILFTYFVH